MQANPMSLTQALTLATLLIEWEIESPAVSPPPLAWEQELRAAKQTINEAINRQPGEFFTAPPTRYKAGRKSNQIVNS